MASADLLEELNCSICLGIYIDPVTLRCGHNFCQGCIADVLDTQEGSGEYSCPECREDFQERPALRKNTTLSNIAQCFLSSQPEEEQVSISCTHCIQFSVPAVKSCLLCEASLCESHLKVHSTSPEHVLSEPTTNLGSRKCSIHKKILEYYCMKDATYICVSCRLDGDHKGHKIKTMKELSDEKKLRSRQFLSNLTTKSKETEKSIQRLQEHKRKVQERVDNEVDKSIAIFKDIRRQLEDQEKKVLSEIYRQGNEVSLSVTQLLKQLEMEREEQSYKIDHVTKLCNMDDPFNVLQEQEPDRDTIDTKVGEIDDLGDLDVGLISKTLNTGLSDFISKVKTQSHVQEEVLAISLDVVGHTCSYCEHCVPRGMEKCPNCDDWMTGNEGLCPHPFEDSGDPKGLYTIPSNDAEVCTQRQYTPWSQAELNNLVEKAPDYRKNPMALHRYMNRLVEIYDTTWSDIQKLTCMVIGETLAADVLLIPNAEGDVDPVPADIRAEGTGKLYCQRLQHWCQQQLQRVPAGAESRQGSGQTVIQYYDVCYQSHIDRGFLPDNDQHNLIFRNAFLGGLEESLRSELFRKRPEAGTMIMPVVLEVLRAIEDQREEKKRKAEKITSVTKVYVTSHYQRGENNNKRCKPCYFCKKKGHMIGNCHEYQWLKNKEQRSIESLGRPKRSNTNTSIKNVYSTTSI